MPEARIAPLLAATAAIALSSCGGPASETTAPGPGSPQREARAAIAAFFGADPEGTCAALSRSSLKRLGGARRCRRAAQGRAAIGFRIDSVRAQRGSAVAVVRSAGRVIQFTLRREDGAWRVSEPLPALPGVPSSVPR